MKTLYHIFVIIIIIIKIINVSKTLVIFTHEQHADLIRLQSILQKVYFSTFTNALVCLYFSIKLFLSL